MLNSQPRPLSAQNTAWAQTQPSNRPRTVPLRMQTSRSLGFPANNHISSLDVSSDRVEPYSAPPYLGSSFNDGNRSVTDYTQNQISEQLGLIDQVVPPRAQVFMSRRAGEPRDSTSSEQSRQNHSQGRDLPEEAKLADAQETRANSNAEKVPSKQPTSVPKRPVARRGPKKGVAASVISVPANVRPRALANATADTQHEIKLTAGRKRKAAGPAASGSESKRPIRIKIMGKNAPVSPTCTLPAFPTQEQALRPRTVGDNKRHSGPLQSKHLAGSSREVLGELSSNVAFEEYGRGASHESSRAGQHKVAQGSFNESIPDAAPLPLPAGCVSSSQTADDSDFCRSCSVNAGRATPQPPTPEPLTPFRPPHSQEQAIENIIHESQEAADRIERQKGEHQMAQDGATKKRECTSSGTQYDHTGDPLHASQTVTQTTNSKSRPQLTSDDTTIGEVCRYAWGRMNPDSEPLTRVDEVMSAVSEVEQVAKARLQPGEADAISWVDVWAVSTLADSSGLTFEDLEKTISSKKNSDTGKSTIAEV
ncbi:hypothetical protein DL764_005451 [Monosporascus ibericus]|uniref:Uncharacterized protein n=1 Tax=Monosporascus ibericus TaxID=155417 RepID=A0A4Q4TCG5_9PEZI|nr:hypothetical protein DL764_005451 [Monosporascus ibericus]